MRRFNQGAYIRVTVSENEVSDFARRWPCFGDVRPLSFTFEASNGDLVEVHGDNGMDESGVAALADDAYEYGTQARYPDLEGR